MEKIMTILKTILFTAISIGLLTIFTGFDGESPEKDANTEAMVQADKGPGQQLYKKHCVSCHQGDGSGVPSMYPPLKDDKRVLGEKAPLIKVILKGEKGPVLNKDDYMGAMASYKHLSDSEIADLLTYIRTSFGNDGGAVKSEEVAEVRKTIE